MKKRTKAILFGIIVILAVGFVVFAMSGENNEYVPPQNLDNGNQNGQDGSGITSDILAQHSSMDDCWVGLQGSVYDLTSWLPRHPGSAGAILPYCGTSTEFENAFMAQHGTRMVSLFMSVAKYEGELI